MNKKQAIEVAKKYVFQLNAMEPASLDAREILDESPVEFADYWCFKSQYEDLDPRRSDGICLNKLFPFYLISKYSMEVSKINWEQYYELKE